MTPGTHVAAFDPAVSRRDVAFDVRRARDGDARDVDAAAHLAAGSYGGSRDVWRNRLTRTAGGPDSLFVAAEADGETVGYGRAGHRTPVDDSDPAPAGRYLTGLVVSPPWRRCGIGEARVIRCPPSGWRPPELRWADEFGLADGR